VISEHAKRECIRASTAEIVRIIFPHNFSLPDTANGRQPFFSPDGRWVESFANNLAASWSIVVADRVRMLKDSGGIDARASTITIVLNWTEELQRLVPTG
jgi:hypothetical protein